MRHFIILCMLLLLTGCNLSSSSPSLFGVIYTNASVPDSAFVRFDANGDIVSQKDIPAMGIFQIVTDGLGNILLPVQYENKKYQITADDEKPKAIQTLPYPIFVKQDKDFRITTYNSSLNSGTVEWTDQKRIRRITVAGFPRIATYDQTYLYVFATIIEQKKPLVYFINRKSGKIEAQIVLKTDQPNDMQIIDNQLFLTSTANQKQLAVIDTKTRRVKYITLSQNRPEYLLANPKSIFVTYQGNNHITEIDRQSAAILREIQLPQPVFKIKRKANILYVLSQVPNGQGLVGVYDMSTWKIKQKYLLPTIRDTTVQDILIF